MQKKTMKKMLAIILAMAMIFGGIFPCEKVEAKESVKEIKELMLETTKGVYAREEARDTSKKAGYLEAGTVVIADQYVKNSKNNYWYRMTNGSYIYEGNLTIHEHRYDIDYSDADLKLLFCRCGAAVTEGSNGLTQTGVGLAVATGLSAKELAALAGVVVVGSCIILTRVVYFTVTALGGIKIISKEEADRKDKDSDNPGKEVYYPFVYYKQLGANVKIYKPMDKEEASEYLVKNIHNKGNIKMNIYTPKRDDAKELCIYAIKKNPWLFSRYGDSHGNNCLWEIDLDRATGKPKSMRYNHYHIYTQFSSRYIDEKINPHVFFGNPGEVIPTM